MEKTIAISIDEVLREVYAISALRSYLAPEPGSAAFLTTDHRPGLATVVEEVFTELVMRIARHVADCRFPSDSASGNYEITFRMPEPDLMPLPAVRRAVEKWIGLKTMARMASDGPSDRVRELKADAEAILQALAAYLAGPALGGSVRPCW